MTNSSNIKKEEFPARTAEVPVKYSDRFRQ